MPSDEQRALWAAIRENPDDDTPRLVYADWLDDHGDPARAEFIRVQVRLAQLGHDRRKGRKERPALEAREAALLAVHGDAWLAPVRVALDDSKRPMLRRGFPDVGYVGLEKARRVAAAGDRLEPVGPLCVTDCQARYDHDAVAALAGWAGAGCVTWLSVAGAGDEDVDALVTGRLSNLTHIGFWMGRVTDAGIARLADGPGVARVGSFDLKENPIGDVGAFALADSPHIGQLRRLDLYRTRIGPAGEARLRARFGDALQM